jgi:hypothetical protein
MIIHKQLKNRKEVYNFITGDKILDVGGGILPCGKKNYIQHDIFLANHFLTLINFLIFQFVLKH